MSANVPQLLTGRRALVQGVRDERSLAWGIAQALANHGAEVGFALGPRADEAMVRPLGERIGVTFMHRADVQSDDELDALFAHWADECGQLDILVHSIAFAPTRELRRPAAETSRAGFQRAMDVSVYSLLALAGRAAPHMVGPNPSIVTLTFDGARRAYAGYGVMGVAKAALEAGVRYLAHDLGPRGIRVNAISPGVVATTAATVFRGFESVLDQVEQRAPLRRNVTIEDAGGTAVYIASDLARGVTGEVIYVDSGFSMTGPVLGSTD
jgi:enoyl-[acyl-carrier protein] reductase I